MTPENFVYWLQGVLEIGDVKKLNKEQVNIIKDHIKLVLNKVTPDRKTGVYTAYPWTITPTNFSSMSVDYCGTPTPVTECTGIEYTTPSPSINYVIEGSC